MCVLLRHIRTLDPQKFYCQLQTLPRQFSFDKYFWFLNHTLLEYIEINYQYRNYFVLIFTFGLSKMASLKCVLINLTNIL